MPQVELQDGTTVLFMVPGAQGDFEAQGLFEDKVRVPLERIAKQGGQVLLEAANAVREALKSVAPAEIEIEIGIALSKEGSIIVASAKAEASLKIKASWK
jgi:hypothetical protein